MSAQTPPVRLLAPVASTPRAATRESCRLLTPDDLAQRWSVGRAQVYRLTREGKLPAVCVGRYYRYRLEAVEAWEQNGGGGV